MPNGLWYAGGDYTTEHAIPASAFSKGDLLMFNSASSLSRVPSVATGTTDEIAGVALADSVNSIDDKVPYLVPQPDTLFWASWATNLTSNATPGTECDFFFAVANNRYYLTHESANSARAVVVRGNADVGQSVQSKLLVKLIYHAGNLELS